MYETAKTYEEFKALFHFLLKDMLIFMEMARFIDTG